MQNLAWVTKSILLQFVILFIHLYLHSILGQQISKQMRPNRLYSHKSQNDQLNKSHIVENHLDRKNQLINKYQTQTNDLLEQIDSRQPYRKATILNTDRSAKKRVLSSMRRDTATIDAETRTAIAGAGSMKDYNKLILGLEYALETERKKNEQMSQKNLSLQSQISNLRNLLMGPDEQKHYEKTAYKQSQDKISYLENRIIEQKKNYEFIIDSKNETLTNLELQIKTLKKSFESSSSASSGNNDQALSKRVLDLLAELDEIKHLVTKKNIIIERLKYQKVKDDSDSEDEEITKIRKAQRLKFYLEQMQISNKLIMRKNVEIIGLSNKVMGLQKVMDVVQLYLDKKEVRGVDLNILEHPCVNKLRVLLREKAVFEKQLLNQLNDHNKKIATFESELTGRQRTNTEKLGQIISDNKRLALTVTNLQSNIANLQKELETSRRENELLTNQITINKRQFIQQVTKLKEELGTISSVTKNEFDRMKIENLKLSEQNRSLLFLVGQKQREIHKKGEAIKTFEQYREKINTLNVGETQKRRIETVSQEPQAQMGTKLMTMNNFSNWLFEWNKIKNWTNKKTLLNLILDKQEIRATAMESITYLINVLQQCLLQSKNVEIQERGIILLAYFVPQGILKNQNLYLNKILPVIVRGFRPQIEGEEQSKSRLLNQSTLSIMSALSLQSYTWSHDLTNQMLSVNGLKYLFSTIRQAQTNEQVEQCFNTIIMIAKANQMISFMLSFDLNTLIYTNLNSDYHFIIYLLMLVRELLKGNDYLRTQNSVLEYRKLFDILAKDEDQQVLELALQCILLLMDKNTIYTRSLQKVKVISILSDILRKSNDEATQNMLKLCSKVYINVATELESENINKYTKTEIDKLLEIIRLRKYNQFRFTRILKMLPQLCSILNQSPELDEKVFLSVIKLYESYEPLEQSLRVKLNECVNILFERNKELMNKYSNDSLISQLVEAYKTANQQDELLFLLKILIFQGDQKRVTQVLRTGRESMIMKIVSDGLLADYNVAIQAIKLMLLIAKEKYSEKFINQNIMNAIVKKLLNQRGEEEYLGLVLSMLYFFGKVQSLVNMALEAGVVGKVCNTVMERHDKEQIVYKALAVLQACHSMAYKKKILNYLIASDNSLQILKTLNYSLRKCKNKVQMGSRAVFLYDYFNNPTSVQSLTLLTQRNEWVIQDLIMLRNEYIGKVDSMVYKIEMLLHEMAKKSNKVKKLYEKYKVDGDEGSEDGN